MSFRIDRRTLLRGTGAALALPWLEAMGVPVRAAAAESPETATAPVRMAALFMPNGVDPRHWTPSTEGVDWEPTATLEPLRGLQSDVSVLTNLWHQAVNTGDGHYVKTAGWLTGTTITKTTGVDLNSGGVSVDQIAARRIGGATPLPSLELGTEPVSSGVDTTVGYTRVYGSHIAWREPTRPLAKEINPRLAFDRIVRAAGRGDAADQDRPLLDLVREDAARLRRRLGGADRQRMDEYLESVRSLEERLENASRPGGPAWQPRAEVDLRRRPSEQDPADHAERVRLMLDVIVLAFQTDVTRIGTFMFGNSVSGVNFSFLDAVSGGHHQLSHHQDDEDKLRQYQKINQWHVEQYAYLLRRLKEIPEGEGTLLDNCMILFGSGLRDGNRHDPHNLPLILGGRAGGRLNSGRHIVCSKDTPMSNLFVTMLDALGTPVDRFADSTGPIKPLVA